MKRPDEINGSPLTADEGAQIAAQIAHAEEHFSRGDDQLNVVMDSGERMMVRDALAKEFRGAGWRVEVSGVQIRVNRP